MILTADGRGWALLEGDGLASGDMVMWRDSLSAYRDAVNKKQRAERVKSDGPSLSEKQSPSAVRRAQRHHVHHLQQPINYTQHGTGRTESSPHLH